MKKLIVVILSMMLLATSASAIELYVDTTKVETDTDPVIVDGRTLVPLRAIFETLGLTVEWDNDTRTAIGTKDSTTIQVQIDNSTAYVNGVPCTLDVPAQIVNNRTMVPARFIAESLGCKVSWYNETQTVGVMDKLRDLTIYATPTGKKYHYDGSCNGGHYYATDWAEIMGRHLTPCNKCVEDN